MDSYAPVLVANFAEFVIMSSREYRLRKTHQKLFMGGRMERSLHLKMYLSL